MIVDYSFKAMSKQTRAELALRKAREATTKIKSVWDARKEITVPDAKKVTTVRVETAFMGLKWEAEFTVKGKGTHVCITN